MHYSFTKKRILTIVLVLAMVLPHAVTGTISPKPMVVDATKQKYIPSKIPFTCGSIISKITPAPHRTMR